MESRTFYLKYRPQKIDELDLVDVQEGLGRVLRSGKVPHALLFSGPRGTGKTSAARIVAKAINCQSKGQKPCNRCQICQEITNGSALDLIEIDAASNRGIDDIRNLREKIKLAPARTKYKVYIIDEVHMLTTEAFNALLKTLEEPPAHAVFILCTTAPEKLPKTIISRCTRFNFRKAKTEEIISGPLKRAVKGEGLKPEKGVLEEIAKSVDGSFRDAHKILEQLSFGGKKITLKATKELLGKIESLAPEKLLAIMAKREAKPALEEIDRVVMIGGDLTVYVQEILDNLRLGLLAKVGMEGITPAKEIEALSLEELKELIRLFSRAANEIKTSPIPQLPVELVVVEWCSGEEKNEAKEPTTNPPSSGGSKDGIKKLNEIRNRWEELLAGVRPLNHSVEALLRAARPSKVEGEFLTLEVFYKFHKERLESEKCRTVVEEIAGQILGVPIKLRCVLGQKSAPQAQIEANPGEEIVDDFSSDADADIIKAAEEIFGNGVH